MEEAKVTKEAWWKKLIPDALVDAIVVGGMEFVKGAIVEHGPKVLRSSIGGLGTNDEALFQSACAYAMLKHGVTTQEISKIVGIISAHPEARARIIEIIGKDEQSTTLETPSLDKSGVLVVDKKGKPVMSKTTANMNVRGGQAIFVMSKMTEAEILIFLQASGGFDTFGHNLKKVAQNIANNPNIQTGAQRVKDIRNSIDSWFANH